MIFVVLQLIGGILANSIAIMSDTAHLSADLIGFLISIFSIKMALRPADKALSYGYDRAEILGTAWAGLPSLDMVTITVTVVMIIVTVTDTVDTDTITDTATATAMKRRTLLLSP